MPKLWRAGAGKTKKGAKVESHRAGGRDFDDAPRGHRRLLRAKETAARVSTSTTSIHAMKTEINPELDALLPAILDKVFKGEL